MEQKNKYLLETTGCGVAFYVDSDGWVDVFLVNGTRPEGFATGQAPVFGYRRLRVMLRRSGERLNHKWLHRINCKAGLKIRRKKRKHCVVEGKALVARTSANQERTLDFAHDAVACGRAIRVLSVVDAYTRECLALEVDTSFASRRVPLVSEAIVTERGVPQAIRCDNRPELTSRHLLAWCIERDRTAAHPAGKANRERPHRELLQAIARRMFVGELVSEFVRPTAQDHSVFRF